MNSGVMVTVPDLQSRIFIFQIISVHRDGSATYADYGPRGGGKPIWGGGVSGRSIEHEIEFFIGTAYRQRIRCRHLLANSRTWRMSICKYGSRSDFKTSIRRDRIT